MTQSPVTQSIGTIACIGEAMIELGFPESRTSARVGFAGDTLNTAIYLARCLDHAEADSSDNNVAFVSALGDDPFSADMRQFITDHGVDASCIRTIQGAMPGVYSISTDSAGERSFHYWRQNSAARSLFDSDSESLMSSLEEYSMVYFSGITLAILPPADRQRFLTWLKRYRELSHTQIAFDSNYRPQLWQSREEAQEAITEAWSLTDIALPSLDDEQNLFDDQDAEALRTRLLGLGVKTGAIKCGEAGPMAIPESLDGLSYPLADSVVDTTAAGDSFNGAYLASLIRHADQRAALEAGHRCASQVIGSPGAIVPIATWKAS